MNAYPQILMNRIMEEITCDSRTYTEIHRKVKDLAEYASDQADRAYGLNCALETQKDLRKKDAAFFEGEERDLRAEIMRLKGVVDEMVQELHEERQTVEKLKDDSAMRDEIKDLREKLRSCEKGGRACRVWLESVREQLAASEKERFETAEGWNATNKELLRVREDLKAERANQDQKMQCLRDQHQKMQSLRDQRDEAFREAASLREKVKFIEDLHSNQARTIGKLQRQTRNCYEPGSDLMQALEQRREIIRELEKENQNIRYRLARISDMAKESDCE